MQIIEIDPSTADTAEQLFTIYTTARANAPGLTTPCPDLSTFATLIDGETILAATAADHPHNAASSPIVGFAAIWTAENFLHHLYVSPSHQGQGIGSQLLQACLAQFGPPLTLKCVNANTAACRFYEHHSFQAIAKDFGDEGLYTVYQFNASP